MPEHWVVNASPFDCFGQGRAIEFANQTTAAKVLHAVQEAGLRLDDELIRVVLKQTVEED